MLFYFYFGYANAIALSVGEIGAGDRETISVLRKGKGLVVVHPPDRLDLTADTVTPSTLMQGYTAHAADGSTIVGTVPDGDNPAYGGAYVGTAIVGSAVLTE